MSFYKKFRELHLKEITKWLMVGIFFTDFIMAENMKPNIIFILADDMGFNDVSFRGSDQIPTYNIDALGFNGVIINNMYTQALCTPSRSALLTGKYPIRTGMQHSVILEAEPWGLPLNEKLLPQYLKEAGYSTHLIGKWHLGFFQKEYTPTFRGFDTHFGYWQGHLDFYNYVCKETYGPMEGYDMRKNMEIYPEANGTYMTDLFTKEAINIINKHDTTSPMFMHLSYGAPHAPLQAPQHQISKFNNIRDPDRATYAAMVSKMDESIGDIIEALNLKGMLKNSVIIFMSDNGAPTHGIYENAGSNFPLRGIKDSEWEGGVRSSSVIWSPLIQNNQRVYNGLMHMVDWLPTFLSMAGIPIPADNIDGISLWDAISTGAEDSKKRLEVLYNIDESRAAIRLSNWKYIEFSDSNDYSGWYGESGRTNQCEGCKYDLNLIMNSSAGIAIENTLTQKDKLLTIDKIKKLREEATLKCDNKLETTCNPIQGSCLFDLESDPCEKNNLVESNALLMNFMKERLREYKLMEIKPRNEDRDLMADPKYWNGSWVNWKDFPLQTFSLGLSGRNFQKPTDIDNEEKLLLHLMEEL